MTVDRVTAGNLRRLVVNADSPFDWASKSPAIIKFALSYEDQVGTNQTHTFRLKCLIGHQQGHHLMVTRETFGFVMPRIESLAQGPITWLKKVSQVLAHFPGYLELANI